MDIRARRIARLCTLAAAFLAGTPAATRAQLLPSGPIAFADGRITIAGDVSASYGSADPGFFDYTDYEHSALRMVRVNISASIKANEHFAILGDLQTENADSFRPYALFLRVRPWTKRAVDIQIGRVPPTFGAFGRRTYMADNPLIGYPLAYQYLTTMRPDALPASADELLQKRGGGWLLRYATGNPAADHGVPLVNALRWDTGVQVHAAFLTGGTLAVTASVTNGTLSNPRVRDDNGGKQTAGRAEWRPTPGLTLGTSFARGEFLADTALRSVAAERRAGSFTQSAWGADLEHSRDYYLVRAEVIVSGWRLPTIAAPVLSEPLRAIAASVEGRYKITPGLYAAARADRLTFSSITGTLVTAPWDAPVTRLETGIGVSIQRNLLLKFAYQRNDRDGGRLRRDANQVATQVVYWF